MEGAQIVFVTGANTGLGLEIVKALCSSKITYEIILGGRSIARAEQAAKDVLAQIPSTQSRIHPIQIDLEQDNSIEAAFEEVEKTFGKLDALVNNAGAQFDQELPAGTMTMRQVWNQTWNVNTTGTQVVTATFIPLLLKSENPRLLFITSGTSTLAGTADTNHPINRVPPKGWPKTGAYQSSIPAYRSSKTGMNMMMREWARNLKEDGVKVCCISPGFLATGLGGNQEKLKSLGARDPALGGALVKDVVEGKRDNDAGKVILSDGVQPW